MNFENSHDNPCANAIARIQQLPRKRVFCGITTWLALFSNRRRSARSPARDIAKREYASQAKLHQENRRSRSSGKKLGLEKCLTYGLIEWR